MKIRKLHDWDVPPAEAIAIQRGLAGQVGGTTPLPDFELADRAAGSSSPLSDRGQVIGAVVRSKNGVQPLFVSPGHRIDLDSSVRVVLGCVRGYRLPEPTRLAHEYVNAARRRGSYE